MFWEALVFIFAHHCLAAYKGLFTQLTALPWPRACVACVLPQPGEKAHPTFAYTDAYLE